MSIDSEFSTVDLLVNSDCERRGVDAFCLSIIKTERQIRRIFTHIVYQSPAFTADDIDDLIKCLADSQKIYLEGLINGIAELSPVTLKDMYQGDYDEDRCKLKKAQKIRNKIFHGQLTGEGLGTSELLTMVNQLREWCAHLANGAMETIGYDGIGDSFRKSQKPIFKAELKVQLDGIVDYRALLRRHVER